MNSQTLQHLSRTRSQLSADFVDLSERYAALCNSCSQEQLTWRPPEGSWNIAECVHHVALSVSHYLVPMRQAVAKGGPPAPSEDYLFVPGGWFSTAFLRRIGPQVTTKFKAPRKIRPLAVQPEKVDAELHDRHAEGVSLLTESVHLDFNRIRFTNPFFPVLHFTIAAGFLILAAHGRRHLLQAQRVTEMQGFPTNTSRRGGQ